MGKSIEGERVMSGRKLKIMYIHDVPIYKNNQGNYFTLHFSYEFMKNMFLNVFDEVIVTTRCRDISVLDKKKQERVLPMNGEKVYCKPCYSYEYGKDIQAILNINLIRKEMRKTLQDVDCVIAMFPGILSTVAYFEAKKINKPFVSFLGACPWDIFWNSSKIIGRLSAPIFWWFTRYICKKSKWVWYVTDEFLQRRYPSKNEQFVCSDVVIRDADEKVLDNKQGKLFSLKKSDKIVLGTAATVQARHKGQEYGIEAISILNKSGYNFEYQLVGTGDCSYLKSVAERFGVLDKVVFKGFLSEDELYNWYDNIDIYIQPSLQEGLPRALIEAMSRGCACIGSTTGGIPELLQKEYIFERKNVKSTVKIIENLINDMPKCSMAAFVKSQNFRPDLLKEKQTDFLIKIKAHIESGENS